MMVSNDILKHERIIIVIRTSLSYKIKIHLLRIEAWNHLGIFMSQTSHFWKKRVCVTEQELELQELYEARLRKNRSHEIFLL